MKLLDMLRMGRRGSISQLAMGVALAAIFVGSVAVPIILGINTSTWTARDVTMFAIIPTVMIAAMIYAIARESGMV